MTVVPNQSSRPYGLYVIGFIGQYKVVWLVDTGAVRNVLSYECYKRLPEDAKFPLHEDGSQVFVADGRRTNTYGTGEMTIRIGTQDVSLRVLVADIEDSAILGMEFLSDVDAKIDLVQQQLLINGEEIDCCSESFQQLSLRCVTRRVVVIGPHCEAVIPVHLIHRQSKAENANQGLRILEPCGNRLQDKGLYIGRTLVSTGDNGLVPVRILNTTDKTQTIGAQTVVAVAKPVSNVAELEFPETNPQGSTSGIDQSQRRAEESGDMLPDPLRELWRRSSEQLTKEESQAVAGLLHQHKDVFSLSEQDLGRTNLVTHNIDTGDARPIKQHPRRTSPSKHAEIERQVEDLLQRGIVKKSNSPWSSPVVLVTKKDGSQRFCVDYRQVNAVTVKDAYPLPRIDDSLCSLSGAEWFSTLDLASGYWQVPMDPASSGKAAFVTTSGLYEWNVMPFGLTSSPSTFERLMELILAGLRFETCLIYLDDTIVYGRTFQEELERLEEVFVRFASAGLKLKPSKCLLFQKRVAYLGHIVSEEGIETDPAKVKRVQEWPVPENATEVKSFLGLASYYGRFVPNFALVARPLHKLTEVNVDFTWTSECQMSFDTLKTLLATAPVLSYPDFTTEFILDTDASNHGIGAVLSQLKNGKEHPVAYASRTLTKAERNYCVTRKELLAVVEFVKQFRHYLQGPKFRIRTDHAPLRSVLKVKEPEGQLARWIEFLSVFTFGIEYREGQRHQNADAMSRRPCNDGCKWCKEWKKVEQVVSVAVQTDVSQARSDEFVKEQTEILHDKRGGAELSSAATEHCFSNDQPETWCKTIKLEPTWTREYLHEQQAADPSLKVILQCKGASAVRPKWEDVSPYDRTVKALWAQWDQLEIRDQVLCRRWEEGSGTRIQYQIVLPSNLQETALRAHHNHTTASHRGVNKTLGALRARYYWPGLTSQVKRWIKICHECGAKKNWGRKRRSPLKQYVVGAPMERLAMDILGPLPQTPRGNKFVLVVTDYFTKWTESYPIPNQEAVTVAEKLVGEFVCRFGVPRELHSDQGTNFESKVMAEVCKLLDIEKTRTTPLHPQSDGQVERYNRTLVEMLRGKLKESQEDWDLQLQPCMMAYRSSVHESTGETPNMLMLGREIEVPLDVVTESTSDMPPLSTEYALALQQRLAGAHEVARRHLGRAAERQKRNYDKRVSSKPFRVGDSVWLHNVRRKKGRNPKLDCPWEGPYLVVSVLSDVTYRIQKSRRAKAKVIHADRLKPYLGPALRSWISEEGEAVTPVSQVASVGEIEPVIPGGSVPTVPREGVLDGSIAVESQNSVRGGLQPDSTTISEKPESDAENSDDEADTRRDTDAEIPADALPVVPVADQQGVLEDRRTSSQGSLPHNVRTRYGRERREPNRYGDWV